jgi:inner membrane protein
LTVDPATHALTSFALVRGLFPRRPWWFVVGVVLAGTIADLDLLSTLVGPNAYLYSRDTFTHSLLGTVAVVALAFSAMRLMRGKRRPLQKAPAAKDEGFASFLLAAAFAAVLHVLLDVCTSAGVVLLWPWREIRFAWDWLPRIDPWILALLLAGILLPELFGLVGSEIGTKNGAPRGRSGALAVLVLVLIYVGARAALHENAIAQLDAHTYRGESPRRLAAFADPVSLITWHGVVETAAQICSVDVPAAASARFDPESGLCVHKPEDSALVQAAQRSAVVKKFLEAARFPKASVGTTVDGTEVAIRDARDSAEDGKRFTVAVRVLLDRNGRITSQELLWASEARLR